MYAIRSYYAIADFKKALQINPNYGVAQKNKVLVEQYKTDKFNAVMNLVTTGLNTATNTMNSINNVNNSKVQVENKTKNTNSNTSSNTKSQTPDCDNNWHIDSQTYSKWTNVLIDMSIRDYNDDRRRYAQSQMKEIREKWTAKGCLIPKSKWEDWDGAKNDI